MNSEFSAIGRLSIRQTEAKNSKIDLELGKYDLILSTLSWESRCTYAVSALGPLNALHAFRFGDSEPETERRKNGFLSQLRSRTKEFTEVKLKRSSEYSQNIRAIQDQIEKWVVQQKRPLRVLFDITCFPKSYILFLLGMGFEKGYFAKFDCLYSEGDYTAIQQSDSSPRLSEHGPISEGKWDSLSIPFFEPDNTIPKSRDVLVALGGEVGLTVPFIEKYEPVRLKLIGINQSFGEQESLREILTEPNVSQEKFDVCDAVQVAMQATNFCKTTKEDVVSALAVGSKPHALGLGIAALSEPKMEVVCRVPKRYTMLDVPASGRILFYEIEDRFEPHAYL